MAYTDIIATIINSAKSNQICDALHDIQVAGTEEDFIVAGLPEARDSYRNGVMTDAMFSSLTEATLNIHFIFTTGTFTITDPTDEVYIFKNATVTLNATGNNKCKVNVLGNASLILVAGNNSYVTVRAFGNSTITITINDDAIVDFTVLENTTATINENNNGIINLSAEGQNLGKWIQGIKPQIDSVKVKK